MYPTLLLHGKFTVQSLIVRAQEFDLLTVGRFVVRAGDVKLLSLTGRGGRSIRLILFNDALAIAKPSGSTLGAGNGSQFRGTSTSVENLVASPHYWAHRNQPQESERYFSIKCLIPVVHLHYSLPQNNAVGNSNCKNKHLTRILCIFNYGILECQEIRGSSWKNGQQSSEPTCCPGNDKNQVTTYRILFNTTAERDSWLNDLLAISPNPPVVPFSSSPGTSMLVDIP